MNGAPSSSSRTDGWLSERTTDRPQGFGIATTLPRGGIVAATGYLKCRDVSVQFRTFRNRFAQINRLSSKIA
jgi:hypothetical protein